MQTLCNLKPNNKGSFKNKQLSKGSLGKNKRRLLVFNLISVHYIQTSFPCVGRCKGYEKAKVIFCNFLSDNMINLDQPRWDQNSYWGRAQV